MVASINASTSAGVVTTADTSGILQLQTASTAALTIDASQNVGIGTTSPDLKLSIAGAMNLRNSSRAGAFEIDSSGNLWAGTATTASNIYLETGHSTTGLPSTGTARVTVNQYGLGLGATPSSGTGITFPATINASSNANTLDDYEEGTWTPVVTAQSGSLTSYTSAGSYTKIGNIVTLYCNVQVTSVGTSSGQMFITGCPFNTLLSGQYMGVTRETTATGYIYFPMIAGSQISIQNETNGGVTWSTNYRYQSTNVYETT